MPVPSYPLIPEPGELPEEKVGGVLGAEGLQAITKQGELAKGREDLGDILGPQLQSPAF